MYPIRDEFLTERELYLYWNAWLYQAQSTNDLDADYDSHGVFSGLHIAFPNSEEKPAIPS